MEIYAKTYKIKTSVGVIIANACRVMQMEKLFSIIYTSNTPRYSFRNSKWLKRVVRKQTSPIQVAPRVIMFLILK